MIVNSYLQIARLTNNCPSCGSDQLGKNKGCVVVKHETYIRKCECGFHLEYDTKQGVSRNKVVKAIKQALEAMR